MQRIWGNYVRLSAYLWSTDSLPWKVRDFSHSIKLETLDSRSWGRWLALRCLMHPGQTIFYTKMTILQKSVNTWNPTFHVFRVRKYNRESFLVIRFIKIRFLQKSHWKVNKMVAWISSWNPHYFSTLLNTVQSLVDSHKLFLLG